MKRSKYTLRRLLALALVLVMVGSLFAGCSKKAADPTVPSEPNETIAETAAPTNEPTDAPTEAATEAPTEPVETVPPVLMGTVNADNLNVRSEPYSTADILKRLAINTRIEILEQKIVDGVNWGRIAEGWINLNYVTIGVEFPDPEAPNTGSTVVDNKNNIGSGSVTTSSTTEGVVTTGLNIRKDSNADSTAVGSYKQGDKVTILERSNGWGRTNKGWINLKYVDFTGKTTASSSGSSSSGTNSATVSNGNKVILGYGTVVKTTSLAIRSGPGTNYTQVSYIRMDERHPYYQTSTNGWVRMQKGWVNADYLALEYVVDEGTDATVNVSELSVREDPDYNSDKLATYEKGDEVTILEVKGTWGLVEYESGQYGWIDLDKVKLPTPVSSDYSTGVATITADALHIREKASASSDALGVYEKGDKVDILEVKGNWGRTEDGWINLKYTKMETVYSTGTGTITASKLNVRELPDEDSDKIGSLKNGDKVIILDTEGTWGKIEYEDGEYGWISLKYVKLTSTSTDSSSSSSSSSSTSGKYKVTITTPINGTLKASTTSCNKGTKVTLTATPATGHKLASVVVVDADGNAIAVTNNSTFTMPAANVTVTATFALASTTPYTITKDVSGDGDLDVAGTATEGTKVVMTANPDAGYALSSLSVTDEDGKTVAVTDNTYFTMPKSNVTVKAVFAASSTKTYAITPVSISNGTVTAVDKAAEGAKVVLTVKADEGYSLKSGSVSVKDKDGKTVKVSGSGESYSFTMPKSEVTVGAIFEAKQYTVTKSVTGSGTVTINNDKCAKGTPITVTATPATGYVLDEILVLGPNNAFVADTASFTMPAFNVTVKVTFAKAPHTVTINTDGNGTVTANKTSATEGTEIKLTVTPAAGYKLDTIKVDGKAITGTSFTMPATDAAVAVTFKKDVYTITAKTTTNGTIKVTPTTAEMGTLITVTITPNTGYQLTDVSILQGTDTVAGVSSDGNVYTFTMPAGKVTIGATFTKIPE